MTWMHTVCKAYMHTQDPRMAHPNVHRACHSVVVSAMGLNHCKTSGHGPPSLVLNVVFSTWEHNPQESYIATRASPIITCFTLTWFWEENALHNSTLMKRLWLDENHDLAFIFFECVKILVALIDHTWTQQQPHFEKYLVNFNKGCSDFPPSHPLNSDEGGLRLGLHSKDTHNYML